MTRQPWEEIDPLEFADGVFYLPAMIEIQPRLPHWGHPNQHNLRERLANDRPHGAGIRGRKLLCLLCMRIHAENGQPRKPVWLTLAEMPHGPIFRHEGHPSPHAEHQPETDTHKALKERKARTWQAAGALDVNVEVWRPRARRRPDVLAVGPDLIVAGEVQHSKESPDVIRRRQKSLRQAGDRVVWTTDRNADDIGFLHLVPHLAVPALDDHRLYLRESRLEIVAGLTTFEEHRCGWADMWTVTNRCPVTRKSIPCGRSHLYPTRNPNAYSDQQATVDVRFPCGPRPHLDHLLEGILHGSWLPYRQNNRDTWIPTDAHQRVVTERGGSVEQAESGTVRRRDQATERACERRSADPTAAVIANAQRFQAAVAEVTASRQAPGQLFAPANTQSQYRPPARAVTSPPPRPANIGASPTWLTPCGCGHIASRHTNTHTRNMAGGCRLCSCAAFSTDGA